MSNSIRLMLVLVSVGATCQAQTTVRLMTYNIHHGEGTDGKLDLDRIAAIIVEQRPDIVCLQEVDRGAERTNGLDMPALMAAKLNMNVAFGPNLKLGDGDYGNAILTRFEILSHKNHLLPRPAKGEQRGCLSAVLAVEGHKLTVLSTHFGLKENARLEQAAAIVDTFKKTPLILAGDLNETAEKPALLLLCNSLVDTFAKNSGEALTTIGSGDNASKIDFVLASKDLDVVSSHVVDSATARLASDHLPVLAEISLPIPTDPAKEQGIVDNEDERINESLAPEESEKE